MPEKRSFYAEDTLALPHPGYNSAISTTLKEQESLHEVTQVEGMIVRTLPALEQYAKEARHYLYNKRELVMAELGTQRSAFHNEVTSLARHVDQTIVEPVLPNLIYILTTALSGSILVNKRSLPVRFLTPVVFGSAAFQYFMPRSFANTLTSIGLYLQQFPALVEAQAELDTVVQKASTTTQKTLECADRSLILGVRTARLWVKEVVRSFK